MQEHLIVHSNIADVRSMIEDSTFHLEPRENQARTIAYSAVDTNYTTMFLVKHTQQVVPYTMTLDLYQLPYPRVSPQDKQR
jgi:hypothetical protein